MLWLVGWFLGGGRKKTEVFFQALEIFFFYFTTTSAMYIKKKKKIHINQRNKFEKIQVSLTPKQMTNYLKSTNRQATDTA